MWAIFRPMAGEKKLDKQETARLGEAIAAKHLQQKGLQLLAQNWRSSHLEVDLLMQDGQEVVLVEVKTLWGKGQRPEQQVDAKKQAHLARAAEAYLLEAESNAIVRFDVVAVVLAQGCQPQVVHWPDAFRPSREY